MGILLKVILFGLVFYYIFKTVGGFVLKIEDQQYDSSVASNLKRMKKQLLQK